MHNFTGKIIKQCWVRLRFELLCRNPMGQRALPAVCIAKKYTFQRRRIQRLVSCRHAHHPKIISTQSIVIYPAYTSHSFIWYKMTNLIIIWTKPGTRKEARILLIVLHPVAMTGHVIYMYVCQPRHNIYTRK